MYHASNIFNYENDRYNPKLTFHLFGYNGEWFAPLDDIIRCKKIKNKDKYIDELKRLSKGADVYEDGIPVKFEGATKTKEDDALKCFNTPNQTLDVWENENIEYWLRKIDHNLYLSIKFLKAPIVTDVPDDIFGNLGYK